MRDDQIANLAIAIRLWLDYQILCKRKMLLSEAYLAQPIGEFLRTYHSGGIEAEWNHPNIKSPGRGRPRQIDYALLGRDSNRSVTAIETKWITGSPISKQRLLDDVLRLECVRNPNGQAMTRYFILAGQADHMKSCLGLHEKGISFTEHILPLDPKEPVQVRVCPEPLRKFFKSFQESYKVEVPISYKVKLVANESSSETHVIVWRVFSAPSRNTFSPIDLWKSISVPETETEDE